MLITEYNKVNMKIFISHSSKNAKYGHALVKLLTGLGINSSDITFTSDTSYGIPAGENIFNWLKNRITEKPFVIYLLSPEYYSSVACLNEMGAAWVVENKHRMIFTPDFDIESDNFKNGVLDPREMGFFVNDKDRLIEFAETIKADFNLTTKAVLTNRKLTEFLDDIRDINSHSKVEKSPFRKAKTESKTGANEPTAKPTPITPVIAETAKSAKNTKQPPVERYFQDLGIGKLKDEEVMIVYYAADTARYKLGVGWRASEEVERIQEWEELNDLGDTLSKRYDTAMSRLEMRKLTEVSEVTSHGNPRQVKLIEELQGKLLNLPDNFYQACDAIVSRALVEKKNSDSNNIPF